MALDGQSTPQQAKEPGAKYVAPMSKCGKTLDCKVKKKSVKRQLVK